MTMRRQQSLERRRAAAEIAAARPHPIHRANGDEHRHRDENGKPTYIGNFTKCLRHDDNGFLVDPMDYSEWVRSIDSADPRDIAAQTIGGPPWKVPQNNANNIPVRGWESQGAGSTFELEGPDAQSVTMPPAPALDSEELVAEMAELYWMALCRDIPFAQWGGDATIGDAINSLKKLDWFRANKAVTGSTDVLASSQARRRILRGPGDAFTLSELFRGVTPGEQVGPYLSQFLLAGSRGVNGNDLAHAHADGFIAYGAVRIDQRVRQAPANINYMTTFDEWLDVQNGANLRGRENAYVGYRFMATPRDLATYVHYDALYEAYLNACLLLLSVGAPVDPGLPFLRDDAIDKQTGFAQFGGPHILSLVTEVATRALKAVRYQKYNVHRRCRPEAVGGRLHQLATLPNGPLKDRLAVLQPMLTRLSSSAVKLDVALGDNWLLPMAFPEGSPTHPSYGAGHATVAAACTTVLKAWFDHGWTLPFAFEPVADGLTLTDVSGATPPLTVEGELNKVAGNIAIGRNWAGVHYYSDYIESFRIGEQIALGILEEQKICYGETWSLDVPLMDGTVVRI
ncbi:MAG: vanadium-dependent haloperoxidase [Nitrospira sp.]|nr:vanadium-dependent haloperoxidase [Nitrospira sp.]MDH4357705.1 vanadium-dependent haloperoxidase [Nitrospira sp.]MDH5320303.1 vanadium-dependent haloperoxidase [Nitrospira sp.]